MKSNTAGFTLLETLVALAIIALALGSAMRAIGSTASAAGHLRDHTLATWIAENRLAEMRARQAWPPIGQRQGRSDMGGSTFLWTEIVSGTPNPLFRRVDIEVFDASDNTPINRMSGFAVRPLR